MTSSNDGFSEKWSVEKYAGSVKCVFKRLRIKSMVKYLEHNLTIAIKNHGSKIATPEIIIKKDDSINAEGMAGAIIINSGVIDHCLGAEPCFFIEDVIKNKFECRIKYDYSRVSTSGLEWVALHELFHIMFKHNNILSELGGSDLLKRALEHDADMCSVAVLYRNFKYASLFKENDIEIKKIIFYDLFWTIRTFPNNNDAKEHPYLAERIFYLVVKLSQLRQTEKTEDFPTKNTKKDFRMLLLFLFKCEKEFLVKNKRKHEINLKIEIEKIISDNKFSKFSKTWDEVREKIKEVDGRGEIIVIGPEFI